jgi:hypothetical protein
MQPPAFQWAVRSTISHCFIFGWRFNASEKTWMGTIIGTPKTKKGGYCYPPFLFREYGFSQRSEPL